MNIFPCVVGKEIKLEFTLKMPPYQNLYEKKGACEIKLSKGLNMSLDSYRIY